jgi:hypothetical protein
MIKDSTIIKPYGIEFFVLSTETVEEDKNAESLLNKEAKEIGIGLSTFNSEIDDREWQSAFDYGHKNNKPVAVIYIHKKRITMSCLLHELIHALNWINGTYAVCTEYGKDESVAYFFEYLVSEIIKLLNRNSIKISNYKLK